MKKIIILFLLSLTLLEADEIQRVESILHDIAILNAENQQLSSNLALEKKRTKDLNAQIIVLNKKLKKKLCLKTQREEKKNTFPDLTMKKKYASSAKLVYFKASAFRIKGDAPIYDSVDGKKLTTWSDQTSFTSNQRVGKWIKITGYFVDKVWQPSSQEMWVKSSHVLNRTQVSE